MGEGLCESAILKATQIVYSKYHSIFIYLFLFYSFLQKTPQKKCLFSFLGIKSECDHPSANSGFALGKKCVCVVPWTIGELRMTGTRR